MPESRSVSAGWIPSSTDGHSVATIGEVQQMTAEIDRIEPTSHPGPMAKRQLSRGSSFRLRGHPRNQRMLRGENSPMNRPGSNHKYYACIRARVRDVCTG